MVIIWILLTFFSSTYTETSLTTECREIYQHQSQSAVEKIISKLDKKSPKSMSELGYYYAFTAISAQYSSVPWTKYKLFKKGYDGLNGLIEKHPQDPELRFHRLMLEKHAPSFLIDTNHQKQDKKVIETYATESHPMYRLMMEGVK